MFGPNAVFEAVKTIAQGRAVGAIAALALFPKLDELAALVGMPPAALLPTLAHMVLRIAQRAGDRLPARSASSTTSASATATRSR